MYNHLYIFWEHLKYNNSFFDPITRLTYHDANHRHQPAIIISFIHRGYPLSILIPPNFRSIAFISRYFNILSPSFFSVIRSLYWPAVSRLFPSLSSPSSSFKNRTFISSLPFCFFDSTFLLSLSSLASFYHSLCPRKFPFRWPHRSSPNPSSNPPGMHKHHRFKRDIRIPPPCSPWTAWPTSNVPTTTTCTCLRHARE